jgi:hypothetical protein
MGDTLDWVALLGWNRIAEAGADAMTRCAQLQQQLGQ